MQCRLSCVNPCTKLQLQLGQGFLAFLTRIVEYFPCYLAMNIVLLPEGLSSCPPTPIASEEASGVRPPCPGWQGVRARFLHFFLQNNRM